MVRTSVFRNFEKKIKMFSDLCKNPKIVVVYWVFQCVRIRKFVNETQKIKSMKYFVNFKWKSVYIILHGFFNFPNQCSTIILLWEIFLLNSLWSRVKFFPLKGKIVPLIIFCDPWYALSIKTVINGSLASIAPKSFLFLTLKVDWNFQRPKNHAQTEPQAHSCGKDIYLVARLHADNGSGVFLSNRDADSWWGVKFPQIWLQLTTKKLEIFSNWNIRFCHVQK